MDRRKPERIYKYEAFSIQSLENLKSRTLYFGSAANFNDPYDCALMPTIKVPSDEDIDTILAGMIGRESNSEAVSAVSREFSKMSVEQKRAMFVRVAEGHLVNAVENFKDRGVTCFSEKNDNVLMWSHYGGRYRGFCLEFSTAFEPFTKLKKVLYGNEFPVVDLVQLLDQKLDIIELLFCIKAVDWSYEAEWRAFHKEAGTSYHYPEGCLTGVYFGPEMNPESMDIIALIVSSQDPRTKFWRGKRSSTEFKVEFEQVTYTPYLEAKKLGLVE